MGTFINLALGVQLGSLSAGAWQYLLTPGSGNDDFIVSDPQGPFRPPNWGVRPQTTLMTVTQPNATTIGNQTGQTTQQTNYYFDAVFLTDHDSEGVATEHPVQIGAAITDHFYVRPSRVTLEVGFSDLLQSFVPGQYSGGSGSKSVNAYQTMRYIQSLGTPITLVTRLYTYTNMVITRITSPDDRKTIYGARIRIEFRQIIPAQVSLTTFNTLDAQILQQPLSARPQDLFNTPIGQVVPGNVPTSLSDGYSIDNIPAPFEPAGVPGAGTYSSNQIPLVPSH